MRRKERQMDDIWAYELMEHTEYATISMLDVDGAPYAVVVSPVLMEGALYFHSAQEGRKKENILRDPHVCVSCVGKTKVMPQKFTTQYESAVIKGNATFIEENDEKTRALQKICEKYIPADAEGVDIMGTIRKLLDKTAICRVDIMEITGKANIMEEAFKK